MNQSVSEVVCTSVSQGAELLFIHYALLSKVDTLSAGAFFSPDVFRG
jgi:hypothetical protein